MPAEDVVSALQDGARREAEEAERIQANLGLTLKRRIGDLTVEEFIETLREMLLQVLVP